MGSVVIPGSDLHVDKPDENFEILEVNINPKVDERLYVDLYSLERKYSALVDSGATKSVVGGAGWNVLKRAHVKVNKTHYKYARVANGAKAEVIGSISLPLNIGEHYFVWEFIVIPSISQDMILGIDFVKKNKAIADFGKQLLIFPPPELCVDEIVVSREMLSASQKNRLEDLIKKYTPRLGKASLGCTHLIKHRINTGSSPAIRSQMYHYSPKLREVLHKGLDEWIKLGVVEPSRSPWRSPILLVKKKDNDYRWVVDFREINKVSVPDAYPMPRVNDILDSLRDAKYLSSIDLKSAYFQIPLSDESKEKTAFVIPGRGLFQFTRMPQGLNTSAATWQRFIDNVVGDDLSSNCFVYLDDIIIVSKDFDHHMEILTKILNRLMEAGLTINFEKCHFCLPELKYLGYIINRDGLQVNPEKVSAITEFPRPSSPTGVKRFVGLASWYRRFVPNFSSIMDPLHKLTGKNKPFVWSEACEDAFNEIKKLLTSAPILACPDFSREFIIHCDASGVGLGAILAQQFDDGERVIAYASRSLRKEERNYTATELECLCVLWAIEKFRCYVEGYEFTVITDHSSLRWLDNLKDPVGRLGRWAVRLQQYTYKIIHRKGKENEAPDALSRAPIPEPPEIDLIFVDSPVQDVWYNKMLHNISQSPSAYPYFKIEGEQIFKKIFTGVSPEATWVRLVPKEKRKQVLEECHDAPLSGHFGFYKTFNRIRVMYYWPGMRKDIGDYIGSCTTCLEFKSKNSAPVGLMGARRVVTAPMEIISCDLMGPLPRSASGHAYVVVSNCMFSKYVWARPLRDATAQAVATHLEQDIFWKFGVPKSLICDNGQQYRSKEVTELCKKYGVKMIFNFAYHPQPNPTERVNRVLKTMFGSYIEGTQKSWDRKLPQLVAAINSARNEVTKFSPHFLMFGKELLFHADLRVDSGDGDGQELEFDRDSYVKKLKELEDLKGEVENRMKVVFERNERRYNLRRRDVEFDVGQIVYRKNFVKSDKSKDFSKKLAPRFIGPFKIKKRVGYRAYLLEDDTGKEDGPWYVNDLKNTKDFELECREGGM